MAKMAVVDLNATCAASYPPPTLEEDRCYVFWSSGIQSSHQPFAHASFPSLRQSLPRQPQGKTLQLPRSVSEYGWAFLFPPVRAISDLFRCKGQIDLKWGILAIFCTQKPMSWNEKIFVEGMKNDV
jgi:hypothetical protein